MGKIIVVIGARPNFMKMAPIVKGLKKYNIYPVIVHTGQHYDSKMSKNILDDLNFTKPKYFLNVRGGNHSEQTAKIMFEFEKICVTESPSIVVVAGDVNSTLACTIVAAKKGIKVAHVEAGLRSFDKTMPEEINRILTDHASDIFFTTEQSGNENLNNEGINNDRIFFVGNCMIDSLLEFLPKANKLDYWSTFELKLKEYILVTIHRPSNVDNEHDLLKVVEMVNEISTRLPILFPAHPRTQKMLSNFSFTFSENVKIVDPVSYIEMISLMKGAKVVLTDSGGIQEETTALKTPCITYRDNTERPVTTEVGTNILGGTEPQNIIKIIDNALGSNSMYGQIPELWDGNSGKRIAKILSGFIK